MTKHRAFHFDGDGSLKESAILIHITVLERDNREENLDLELLRYVNAYREKTEVQSAKPDSQASHVRAGEAQLAGMKLESIDKPDGCMFIFILTLVNNSITSSAVIFA